MKKLVLIFLTIGLCFSSCSKDDDEPNNDIDKIIGLWGNYKDKDLETGEFWEFDYNERENQSEFLDDFTFKSFIDETSHIDGVWKNLNDGTYEFKYLGITEIIDIDFVGNDEMIFRFTDEEYYWKRLD